MDSTLGGHILADIVTSAGGNKQMYANYQDSQESLSAFRRGSQADVCAGRLKLANFFYAVGSYSKAEEIVRNVLEDDRQYVLRSRMFGKQNFSAEREGAYMDMACGKCIPIHMKVKEYWTFDIVFFRSEAAGIPHGLQFEFFKSPCEKLYQHTFLTAAVVDTEVFAHYLLFLIRFDSGNKLEAAEGLSDLEAVVSRGEGICYPATARNLLSHCYLMVGDFHKAFSGFVTSLFTQPIIDGTTQFGKGQGNAALWHLFVLIGICLKRNENNECGILNVATPVPTIVQKDQK